MNDGRKMHKRTNEINYALVLTFHYLISYILTYRINLKEKSQHEMHILTCKFWTKYKTSKII